MIAGLAGGAAGITLGNRLPRQTIRRSFVVCLAHHFAPMDFASATSAASALPNSNAARRTVKAPHIAASPSGRRPTTQQYSSDNPSGSLK